MSISRTILVLQAVRELVRYDLTMRLGGFKAVYAGLSRYPATGGDGPLERAEKRICEAVDLAAALYWKRVRCLQRAVAATRLLRRNGIRAELVIGYRSAPFFGHAWIEVGGRVVNDSRVFKKRLNALERIASA